MSREELSEIPMAELVSLAQTLRELVLAVRESATEQKRREADLRRQCAPVIAELARRDMKYVEIGELMALDDSTAHRWARDQT
ncbi:MAG: hypothetical protein ACRDTG_19075 [Pseudonocardiaceae bacterium]